jgi:hypothetical protein
VRFPNKLASTKANFTDLIIINNNYSY